MGKKIISIARVAALVATAIIGIVGLMADSESITIILLTKVIGAIALVVTYKLYEGWKRDDIILSWYERVVND